MAATDLVVKASMVTVGLNDCLKLTCCRVITSTLGLIMTSFELFNFLPGALRTLIISIFGFFDGASIVLSKPFFGDTFVDVTIERFPGVEISTSISDSRRFFEL